MREYETHRFKSSDGVHRCHYIVMLPDGEPKGIVQIAHGMCEYIERYTDLMSFLADNGFVVCGNDHLGHGKTAENKDDLGYFSPENGWQNAVTDMHRLTKIIKKRFPDLPFVLIGHSMGSFLARAYAVKFAHEASGYVFMGTADGYESTVTGIENKDGRASELAKKLLGGNERKVGAGAIMTMLTVAESMKKIRGDRYRSDTLEKIGFGSYNERIENTQTGYEWITRSEDVVAAYAADPLCNYKFTVNGYINLASVLWYISNDRWYSSMPKDIPVLLMGGTADPVGNYGEGVKAVYDKLKDHSDNVAIKLYEGCRHELINELNRKDVYSDLLNFLISSSCAYTEE